MRQLSFDELEKVTGGDKAAADAYIRELCKKYGVKTKLEVLGIATDEELYHHLELYFS